MKVEHHEWHLCFYKKKKLKKKRESESARALTLSTMDSHSQKMSYESGRH